MPNTPDAPEVLAPSEHEIDAARRLEAKLHASPDARVELTLTVAGEDHPLFDRLAEFFKAVVHEIAQGHQVGLVDLDRELSTTEAAEFLGVSRPTLVGLLKDGRIPHRMVGTHRRVPQGPLFDYRQSHRAAEGESMEHRLRRTDELLRGWHTAEETTAP